MHASHELQLTLLLMTVYFYHNHFNTEIHPWRQVLFIDNSRLRYPSVMEASTNGKILWSGRVLYPRLSHVLYNPDLRIPQCEPCQKYVNCLIEKPYSNRGLKWRSIQLVFGLFRLSQNVSFYATTIIDTVTNILTELVLIESRPTAQCSSIAVETGWLMRYPRPVRMIMIKDQSFKERTFAIY
jgi:hypothetical protein